MGYTLWWTNILPWKITFFYTGKIHYFDWAMFHSFLYVHQRVWKNYGGIMIYHYFITIYTIDVFKPIMQHLQSPCLDKTPWVSKAPSIFIDSNTHKIWPLVNLSPTCTEKGNLVGAKSMTQLWPNHVVNQRWIWMNLACDLLANFLLSP